MRNVEKCKGVIGLSIQFFGKGRKKKKSLIPFWADRGRKKGAGFSMSQDFMMLMISRLRV